MQDPTKELIEEAATKWAESEFTHMLADCPTSDLKYQMKYLEPIYKAAMALGYIAGRQSSLEKEAENGWISVKDRLPETSVDNVFVGFIDGSVSLGCFTDGYFYDSGDFAIRPTHWQPFTIPSPPPLNPS